MRIGVDVGGTYTDIVVQDGDRLVVHKVPSTPDEPERAVLAGLQELGVDLAGAEVFAHGTTVGTNAVIQRTGVPTGLLTTRGFRDVLQIRRTTRGKLYDFQWDPPAELVPRRRRLEVAERTSAGGKAMEVADLEGALRCVRGLVADGVEAIAVCFINAYLNGDNERRVREAIAVALPDLPVYLSSEILPEWREFERTSTTVISAYVGPILGRYLTRLEASLVGLGFGYDLLVMFSNGGLGSAESARRLPGNTLESGPAAGVLAQAAIARSLELPDAIGIDIGGTSTDISLVVDGRALLKAEHELEFGTVVAYPMIDVDSIGAGGGTIAWVDAGGLLHVGPQSAGAVPGPVALAAGGTEPTVTDAHVVLRRLGPTGLLGGRVTLDEPAARAALAELGTHLGLGPVEMAAGVLRLTDARIVAAIRQRTVERGLDPRRFALIAYGGAGPLHAAGVAEQLGIERVVVPRYPGTTSAQGLLLSDIRHDFVATLLQGSDELDPDEVERIYAALEREGRERLRREGIPDQAIEFSRSVDARYRAQTHELNVAVEQRPFSGEALRRLLVRLRDQHRSEFGHAPEGNEPVELVNLRVGAIGLLDHPAAGSGAGTRSASPGTARDVYLDERWQAATVWMREELVEGQAIDGPAVVEQLDSTTIVPPRWTATVHRLGDLVLRPV